MTEFDACIEFLEGCREAHKLNHRSLTHDYRLAKRDGWGDDAIDDIVAERHDEAVMLHLLDIIIRDIGDAVSDKLQEDAMRNA